MSYSLDSDGRIKATVWLPDYYTVEKYDTPVSTAWYSALVKTLTEAGLGKNSTTPFTTTDLWNSKTKSVPESWILPVQSAFGMFIDKSKAEELANWLGGGFQYKNIIGGLSKNAFSPDEFIDASNCYGYFDPTVNIADALLSLKAANKAAHDWAIRAAGAKFKNKKAQEAVQLAQDQKKVQDAIANTVKSAADAVGNIAEGAGKSVSMSVWLLSNLYWIAPVTVGGLVWFTWHNRQELAKVAHTTIAGNPKRKLKRLKRK